MNDENTPIAMSLDEVKAAAASLVAEMKAAAAGPLPPALRTRFIKLRSVLFQRGIFDPILVRFDTATVARASAGEVAEELGKVAMSL
jgi:hypothetical protein